ncbi:MAG: ABC transporter substrate-binding protein [Pseudomonadota bacterium]
MKPSSIKRAGPFQLAILAFAIAIALAQKVFADEADRVVSIGGSVTEIVFALGQQDRLIARDATSQFPPIASDLPDIGYMRALSPEGVLSVDPDLILAEEGSGPPEVIDVLEAAGIEFISVPDGYDGPAITAKIEAVAAALGVEARGAELIAEVEAQLQQATRAVADDRPPRVLFILSLQGGRVMASGTDTAAAGIIALAGGVNAVTEFDGYMPMSDEAVAAAAPDIILMMDRGGNHAAADADLFSHPALSITPAGAAQRVVRIDGLLLLGFGPRTPEAVRQLSSAIGTAQG